MHAKQYAGCGTSAFLPSFSKAATPLSAKLGEMRLLSITAYFKSTTSFGGRPFLARHGEGVDQGSWKFSLCVNGQLVQNGILAKIYAICILRDEEAV